jgi:hypothetical protein
VAPNKTVSSPLARVFRDLKWKKGKDHREENPKGITETKAEAKHHFSS